MHRSLPSLSVEQKFSALQTDVGTWVSKHGRVFPDSLPVDWMGQEVTLVVVSELHSMEAEKTLPVAVADEVLISAGAGVGAGVGAGTGSGPRRRSSATDLPLWKLLMMKAASMVDSALVQPALRKHRSRSSASTYSGTLRKQCVREPLSPQAAAAESPRAVSRIYKARSAIAGLAPRDDAGKSRRRDKRVAGRAAAPDLRPCMMMVGKMWKL